MNENRGSSRGSRSAKVRVRTARRRKSSSTRWLERQLNDPFVHRARLEGYRSRSAFKLLEIDDKFMLLKPGLIVVDLGCAPGGWMQVAVDRVNSLGKAEGRAKGRVIGVDMRETERLPGAETYQLDFNSSDAAERVHGIVGGYADVVLSDMAASAIGHRRTDHLRTVALAEASAEFAFRALRSGGSFVVKLLAGGGEANLQRLLKTNFKRVRNMKPRASRKESTESYVVAVGFGPQRHQTLSG